MVESTSDLRLMTVRTRTPSGSERRMSPIRASTASATVRLFPPGSMSAVPITTSLPFSLPAPVRDSSPRTTSATSRTKIGVPSWLPTATAPISSSVRTRASDRTTRALPLDSTYPAPVETLFASSAATRSWNAIPWATMRRGSGWTWNCFSYPPMTSTPAIPGTRTSCGTTTHSINVLRWVAISNSVSRTSPVPVVNGPRGFSYSRMNVYTSPSPVAIGPMRGSAPGGRSSRTAWSRSAICCRAQ